MNLKKALTFILPGKTIPTGGIEDAWNTLSMEVRRLQAELEWYKKLEKFMRTKP